MNRRHASCLVALATMLLAGAPFDARACSAVAGYLAPSNLDLVKLADAVVLARAEVAVGECTTRFRVVERVKGDGPETLDLGGCSRGADAAILPDDHEASFRGARGSDGSCVRMSYEVGTEYLLLLERRDDAWGVLNFPFSRVNEPVSGRASPWYRAVVAYARIASIHDAEQADGELQVLQARAAGSGEGASPLLAADIADHFRRPSRLASYADLRAKYDTAREDDERDEILWTWARNADPLAKPLFDELLASGRTDGPVATYFEAARDVASLPRFADAFMAADPSNYWARMSPLGAVLALARDEHMATVLRLYAAASEQEADSIERWLALHPDASAQPMLRSRIADRTSGRTATFALAATGDEATAQWATATAGGKQDDDSWVALYALAYSPLPSADAMVGELIVANDARLVQVVQGYAGAANPHARARLAEMVALPARSDELTYWLWRTITEMRDAQRLPGAPELLLRLPADAETYGDR